MGGIRAPPPVAAVAAQAPRPVPVPTAPTDPEALAAQAVQGRATAATAVATTKPVTLAACQGVVPAVTGPVAEGWRWGARAGCGSTRGRWAPRSRTPSWSPDTTRSS